MSQFEYAKPATIEVDTLLHWALVAVLVLGVIIVTYLLISKCGAYWTHRIEQWRYGGHKKHDDGDEEEEE